MRSLRLVTPAFVAALSWTAGCSTSDASSTGTPASIQGDGAGGDRSAPADDANGPPPTPEASVDAPMNVDGPMETGGDAVTDDVADSQPDQTAADATQDETMPTEAGEAQSDGAGPAETGPMCSPPCVHGSCIASGGCSCDPDWSGPLCDMTAPVLVPGVAVAGSVTRGNWAFFSYYGQASGLNVTLTEDTTVGLAWAYLGAGMAPTQTSNLASDENGQSATHTVTYSFASSGMQTWYLGAYGQPAIPTGTQAIAFHVMMTVIP